jgi:hypothetical protein
MVVPVDCTSDRSVIAVGAVNVALPANATAAMTFVFATVGVTDGAT